MPWLLHVKVEANWEHTHVQQNSPLKIALGQNHVKDPNINQVALRCYPFVLRETMRERDPWVYTVPNRGVAAKCSSNILSKGYPSRPWFLVAANFGDPTWIHQLSFPPCSIILSASISAYYSRPRSSNKCSTRRKSHALHLLPVEAFDELSSLLKVLAATYEPSRATWKYQPKLSIIVSQPFAATREDGQLLKC